MPEGTPIPKPGMKKKTKTIIIIVVIALLIIGAVVGYYYYNKSEKLKTLPKSADGLKSGQQWNNNGVITTVP